MKRILPRLAALGVLAASLLVPAFALADGAGGTGKKKGSDDSSASASKKKGSVDDDSSSGGGFADACKDGATKYAARDFPGAVQAYQKAIEAAPKNPLGHYLLGEAQLAAGNLTEAEAAWNRGLLVASDKNAPLHAKILFVLADLRERQKKWDDATAAWQVYLDWAGKNPDASVYAASGQSRQQKIGEMQKQDKAYAVVRQRIADTKNGGVFTDLSKTPAPPPAAK